jgi:hypothetical protein
MFARELAIKCFTSRRRSHLDVRGLGLMLGTWLGIERPDVTVGQDGRYVIHCHSAADAKRLCDHFGGEADGRFVRGYVVDLTL